MSHAFPAKVGGGEVSGGTSHVAAAAHSNPIATTSTPPLRPPLSTSPRPLPSRPLRRARNLSLAAQAPVAHHPTAAAASGLGGPPTALPTPPAPSPPLPPPPSNAPSGAGMVALQQQPALTADPDEESLDALLIKAGAGADYFQKKAKYEEILDKVRKASLLLHVSLLT